MGCCSHRESLGTERFGRNLRQIGSESWGSSRAGLTGHLLLPALHQSGRLGDAEGAFNARGAIGARRG